MALDGLTIVDIASSEHLPAFAQLFYELRKHKGMTLEKAEQTVRNPLYFGNLASPPIRLRFVSAQLMVMSANC